MRGTDSKDEKKEQKAETLERHIWDRHQGYILDFSLLAPICR